MAEKVLNDDNLVAQDNFYGMDDGLAGSPEDDNPNDYTIEQIKVGDKTMNRRVGTFTPKLPSLDEKLKEIEQRREKMIEEHSKEKEQSRGKKKGKDR